MLFWQLKIFDAVVKQGGFTSAAKYLRLSQPAVSSSIRRLEEELGVELFSRFGKRVHLTDTGKIVEKYVSRLQMNLDEMRSEIDELRGFNRGQLLCAAGTTIGVYVLPKTLVDFKKRFPNIELRLRINRTNEAERKVLANEVDLGLVAGRITDTFSLRILPFFKDELVVITSPNHPLAKHFRVAPERLKDFPLILRAKNAPTRELIESCFQKAGIAYCCGMELESTEAIKRGVSQGLGIGIVPLAAMQWEIKSRLLVPVRISGHEIKREFKVIIHKSKRLSGPLKIFLGLLGLKEHQLNL
jgi:DNA-binding transcriptional LysR family regulator